MKTQCQNKRSFLVSSYVECHKRYDYIHLNSGKLHCSSEIKYKCHVIWIKKFKNNRILNYIPAQKKPHGSVYALFSYLWTWDLHQHPEAGPCCCILAQQGCFSMPVLKHWLHSNPGWVATAVKASFEAVTILSNR